MQADGFESKDSEKARYLLAFKVPVVEGVKLMYLSKLSFFLIGFLLYQHFQCAVNRISR